MSFQSSLLPLVLIGSLLLGGCATTAAQPSAGLLPLPASMTAGKDRLRLTATSTIGVPAGDTGARAAAQRLGDMLFTSRGFRPAIVEGSGTINFRRGNGFKAEGYRLDVTRQGAVIAAGDAAGLFYGAVSLWQLAASDQGGIAAVRVDDSPRFRWRGMMLDSARHFQSPAFIRQLIDWMAAHKLNILHWHLVDDQGWRIEIPKYPRLTEISARRSPATVAGAPPLPQVGGFYTQAEIRSIVDYAAERHITIVPEIEMPGHALAPIRAYPELGVVDPPPPAGIESHWGVFPYLYNVDESTFAFLEDVLRDVMALFPSQYIHVGGDEAVKDQWKASPKIQAQMRALGIKDEHGLQSYFIARMERFLRANGRKLIGWDEILEGGIAPGATVMSWRGLEGALAAAKQGHDSVLSPAPTLYLNHIQGLGPEEPPGRGEVISLAEIYKFDPMPPSLPADQRHHILGLQGNLWTEHVRTEERAAYQAFPRMSAVAELGWSQEGSRDFPGFVSRLVPHLERLEPFGLRASPTAFAPMPTVNVTGDRALVALATQSPLEVRYTTNGSAPTRRSPLYREPFEIALPARVRAASFLNGKPLPGSIDRTYDRLTARTRTDTELKLCTQAIALQLEDDAPAEGPRAVFLMDIFNPCWEYQGASLDGIREIALDVGQIPFNFQVGKDIEKVKFRPPATEHGEFEMRLGCEGERIAVLPLAPAVTNPQVTRLTAPIAPRTGTHDLCITYTAKSPDPLWALDRVQLVPGQ